MNEELQDFGAVMNIAEMEDGFRDPGFDLVIGVVQSFYLGRLAFRQLHDIVRRVQSTVIVPLVDRQTNRECMRCDLCSLEGDTCRFERISRRFAKCLNLEWNYLATVPTEGQWLASLPQMLQHSTNRSLCPIMFQQI